MLSLENVTLAFVGATALLKKSLATEKLFDSESSDATASFDGMEKLFLFSKTAQHGFAPFVACSRGLGLCKFQGL